MTPYQRLRFWYTFFRRTMGHRAALSNALAAYVIVKREPQSMLAMIEALNDGYWPPPPR